MQTKSFPKKLFLVTLIFSNLLLILLGWQAWSLYTDFNNTETKLFRLQELITTITATEEIMTMSAHMAASSGDLKWEKRYLSMEPQLDSALKEALTILPDKTLSATIHQASIAASVLVKIDKQAFDLIHRKQSKEAAVILFSSEYEEQKQRYTEGTKNVTVYIQKHISASLHRQHNKALIAVISALTIFLISSIMWIKVFLLAKKHEVNRKQAEDALKQSEKKLQNITSHLAEGIYVLNELGHITFINPEAEHLLGWTMDELNNKGPHNLVHFQTPDGTPLSLTECKMHNVIKTGERYFSNDEVFVRKNGTVFPISVITAPIIENGNILASVTAFRDITERKQTEKEKEKLIFDLQEALATIKTLHGILPICASCKKIRDDKGYWSQIEIYIREHSEAEFSHGICPECAKKLYPEFFKG